MLLLEPLGGRRCERSHRARAVRLDPPGELRALGGLGCVVGLALAASTGDERDGNETGGEGKKNWAQVASKLHASPFASNHCSQCSERRRDRGQKCGERLVTKW